MGFGEPLCRGLGDVMAQTLKLRVAGTVQPFGETPDLLRRDPQLDDRIEVAPFRCIHRFLMPRLARRDPSAVKASGEHPELAIRVVDLLGLRVAACQQSLIESDGVRGIAASQLRNLLFQAPAIFDEGIPVPLNRRFGQPLGIPTQAATDRAAGNTARSRSTAPSAPHSQSSCDIDPASPVRRLSIHSSPCSIRASVPSIRCKPLCVSHSRAITAPSQSRSCSKTGTRNARQSRSRCR
jgi:hypothetical protein